MRQWIALTGVMLAWFSAGAAEIVELTPEDAGKTLTAGYYAVPEGTLSLSAGSASDALAVAEGATVCLWVPTNCSLQVRGGDASSANGGGAGIRVPESAKLVIFGAGELTAVGGAASAGSNGLNGGQAALWTQAETNRCTAGAGGNGGAGGAGAGAGIGGRGGSGGAGGGGASGGAEIAVPPEPSAPVTLPEPAGGQAGKAAVWSADNKSGRIHVVGSVRVRAQSGAGATGGTGGAVPSASSGQKGVSFTVGTTDYWKVANGSGGGGGGGGLAATAGFGYGGSGGGGGGGGACGGYRKSDSSAGDYPLGGCGAGGAENGGSGGSQTGISGVAGDGGAGGATASAPTTTVYVTSATHVEGAEKTEAAALPAELSFKLKFAAHEKLKSVPADMDVTLGSPYGACEVGQPTDADHCFRGWYDGENGTGTCYFGPAGEPVQPLFAVASNVTLRVWMVSLDDLPPEIAIDGEEVPSGVSSGEGWTCRKCVVTLTGRDTPYVLSGTNETMVAGIQVATNASIELRGLTIPGCVVKGRAGVLSVAPGAKADILISEPSQLLTSQTNMAGVFCPSGAAVTFRSEKSGISSDESQAGLLTFVVGNLCERFDLVVQGGAGAPAIGGVDGLDFGRSGDISFHNVCMAATGGSNAVTDVGHALLTDGHTSHECGDITISGGSSLRRRTDTSAWRYLPFTVDPRPYNTYGRRVFPFRVKTKSMTYGVWAPYGLTLGSYDDPSVASSENWMRIKVHPGGSVTYTNVMDTFSATPTAP